MLRGIDFFNLSVVRWLTQASSLSVVMSCSLGNTSLCGPNRSVPGKAAYSERTIPRR